MDFVFEFNRDVIILGYFADGVLESEWGHVLTNHVEKGLSSWSVDFGVFQIMAFRHQNMHARLVHEALKQDYNILQSAIISVNCNCLLCLKYTLQIYNSVSDAQRWALNATFIVLPFAFNLKYLSHPA